jgi:nucleoside-diphosphate-sugar epimerase
MRVTVLGGTGFLGPEVLRQLVDAGCDVLIFHRGVTEPDLPSSVRHIHGDRRELAAFEESFRSFAPDVVVDMRPMTEEHAHQLTSTFAGVARRSVVISSCDVYRAYGRLNLTEPGPPDPVPLRESSPLREQLYADRNARPHDRTEGLEHYDKLLVERVVSAEPRLPATILRLGMVHGPRSYRHYPYLKRMVDRRPGIVLADAWARWRGTLAYSENVAAAIVLTTIRPDAQGAYNVGDAAPTAIVDLVAAIAAAAGWSGRLVRVPSDDLPHSMRPGSDLAQELILDSTRIRRELAFEEPISVATGIQRTVDWMLRHPPTPEDPMGRLDLDYRAEDAILTAR